MVRQAVKRVIPLWKTDLAVMTTNVMTAIPVSLKQGLFQGDSLLFCLCVTPVSHELRKGQGYRSKHQSKPITHLMLLTI